jgi:hypothetical protein
MSQLELGISAQDPESTDVTLSAVLDHMRSKGATRFIAKRLSPNDNSKNQIYLGSAINAIPNKGIRVENEGGKRPRHIADVTFSWVTASGQISVAPHAKLILYPKYPEVRLSGFLLGSRMAPKFLVTCPPQTYPVERSDTGRFEGRQKCQEKVTARSRS